MLCVKEEIRGEAQDDELNPESFFSFKKMIQGSPSSWRKDDRDDRASQNLRANFVHTTHITLSFPGSANFSPMMNQ